MLYGQKLVNLWASPLERDNNITVEKNIQFKNIYNTIRIRNISKKGKKV